MPSLPSVFVELKATTTEFMAKMREAQAEIKKTADVSLSNSERMAQVGKVAFVGLGAAATAFGAIAVKAALEGEAAHAQLVNAVQNTGTAFTSVSPAVEEMSSKFAKLGYENDAVEAALARLVQGTGSMKTALDNMSLAADIAKARNMDLAEAAGSLGKILSGNMRPMAQMGLSAKDAAGNALTAAEAIKLLTDRFGGNAQAQADTYAGKLQALNAEWHNMIEAVGNMLLPVLANLAGHMADVAGWFQKHHDVAVALAGAIGGPLLAAITLYAARQAQAFAASVAQGVNNVVKAIFAIVPAAEAAEVAESGLAVTTALATGGLSLLGAGAGLLIAHMMGQSSATKDVAASTDSAKGAIDALTGGDIALGDAATGATAQLKAQETLFKQLNNDAEAQGTELVKLMGDQQNLDRATKTLTGDTTAHAQAQAASTRATRELGDAQAKLTKLTADYTKLQGGLGMEISLDQNHAHHNLEQAQLNHETAQTKLNEAVAQYGANSVEARQASLDLESATFTLQSAQDSMGNVGQAAWDKVNAAQDAMNQAQQDVLDKTNAQKDALDKLNKPASDLAANTLAWQQAQATLNTDWGKFQDLLIAHPEIRDQMVKQLGDMKANLPKGADVKPLQDLIDKINAMDAAKLAAVDIALLAGAAAKDVGNILSGYAGAAPPPAPAAALPTPVITGTFQLGNFGAPVHPRAAGGPVLPGGTYLVGEGGPELLRMGSSAGSVSPVGMNVQIIIPGYGGDKQELALEVRDVLLRMGRNTVGVGLG